MRSSRVWQTTSYVSDPARVVVRSCMQTRTPPDVWRKLEFVESPRGRGEICRKERRTNLERGNFAALHRTTKVKSPPPQLYHVLVPQFSTLGFLRHATTSAFQLCGAMELMHRRNAETYSYGVTAVLRCDAGHAFEALSFLLLEVWIPLIISISTISSHHGRQQLV